MGGVVLAVATESSEQPFDPYWATVGGRPLLAWSVGAVAQTREIGALALVVVSGRLAQAQVLTSAEGWHTTRVVSCGTGLCDALLAGLEALPEPCAWVVVHDAARPLVTPELVATGIATARRAGAAVAIGPVNETIKRVRDGLVVDTLERSRLALLQTPQVYRRAALLAALSTAEPHGVLTDMATLALASGIALAAFPGGAENLLVRSPDDLAVVASILERRGLVDTPERDSEGKGGAP